MGETEFKIQDITMFAINIFFDKVKLETLHNKLKSIERGQFISGLIRSDNFIEHMEERIPSLQLLGNGFRINVHPNSIMLIITSRPLEDVFTALPSDLMVSPEQLFVKDNFQKLSVDFNAVVGQILGILGLDYAATKFMVRIELRKNDADYQTNRFSKKMSPIIQSLLGESVKIPSSGVMFETEEIFLNIPINAHYGLKRKQLLHNDQITAVEFSGRYSFKNTGTQDMSMILEEYMKRINSVVKKLVGGLNTIE